MSGQENPHMATSGERTPQKPQPWGIDPSTKNVSIACNGEVVSVAFDKHQRAGARLDTIYTFTRVLAKGFAKLHPPLIVFVEQPSGASRGLELCYAVGTIQAAVYAGLKHMFLYPVEVKTITSAQWKQLVLGNGAATKDQYREWAKDHGYTGDSEDEAAALCIAAASRLLVADQT